MSKYSVRFDDFRPVIYQESKDDIFRNLLTCQKHIIFVINCDSEVICVQSTISDTILACFKADGSIGELGKKASKINMCFSMNCVVEYFLIGDHTKTLILEFTSPNESVEKVISNFFDYLS